MAYNKVIYGGDTLIDLTSDTVTANSLLSGITAHDKAGVVVTGNIPTLTLPSSTTTTSPSAAYTLCSLNLSSSNQYLNIDNGYNDTKTAYEIPAIRLQSKTVTPSEAVQTVTVDSDYNGLNQVTVIGIPFDYVGSGIDHYDSTDLTVSGATVTVPAGYYEYGASKSVASGSATVSGSVQGTGTVMGHNTGYIVAGINASITPTVTAGYISAGTEGSVHIQANISITTKTAATYTPGTTNQNIESGIYLAGIQTIRGDANLVGENIIAGKSIFGVQGAATFQKYYTGSSAPSSSLGNNGDIYLQE